MAEQATNMRIIRDVSTVLRMDDKRKSGVDAYVYSAKKYLPLLLTSAYGSGLGM